MWFRPAGLKNPSDRTMWSVDDSRLGGKAADLKHGKVLGPSTSITVENIVTNVLSFVIDSKSFHGVVVSTYVTSLMIRGWAQYIYKTAVSSLQLASSRYLLSCIT